MSAPRSLALLLIFATVGCGGAAATTTVHAESEPPEPTLTLIVAHEETLEELAVEDDERTLPVTEAASAAARVEPLFEEARALAVRFEHAEALAKIGEAQVLLESHATAPADWAALHRALAYRGLFESNLGRQDRARAALAAAALLDSEAELSDVEFPPDILALHAEVAAELRAESPAALAVTTTPSGATVLIDGEAAGRSPITLHAAPGQHYVSFAAFGRAHRNLTVEIAADGNAPLDVELPFAADAELSRQLLTTDDAALAAIDDDVRALLADRYAVDVLVRVQPSGAALALRFTDGAVSGGTVAPGDDGALAALLAALPALPEPEPLPPPEEDEDSVLSSPWFWVVVGALVLGGAAVAIGVVATEEPTPILRATSAE